MPPCTISDLRAGDGLVEARRDLVGALAPDAEVAQLELGMAQTGPVLPLAFGIAGARARVPVRRALRDRVAEAATTGELHA